MTDIKAARKTINQIDGQLAVLFEKRMEEVKKIAAYKAQHALPVKDAEREKEVIAQNCSLIKSEEIKEYYEQFMKNITELSCSYQQKLIFEAEKSADICFGE